MNITAAVTPGYREPFVIEQLTLEDPRPDEIVVRMVAAGICHSDLSTRDGIIPIGMPIVLGHEGAGVVEAIGKNVTRVRAGDHVLLHSAACGTCVECETGREIACANSGILNFSGGRLDGSTSTARLDGTRVRSHFFGQSSFADHVVANQRNATVLPASLDLALAPAFACGVKTGAGTVIAGLRPEAGSSIAIFGAGAVGDAAAIAARVVGCTTVIVIDVVPSRLELAREVGATHTILALDGVDVPAEIKRITGGAGVDYAVEATGVTAVAQSAFASVKRGGAYAQLGFSAGAVLSLDLTAVGMSGVRIQGYPGGMAAPQEFIPRMVALYHEGRFPVDKLVRTYPFAAINEAVEATARGDVIKPILLFDE